MILNQMKISESFFLWHLLILKMFLIFKTEHVKEDVLGTEVHELHFFSMVDNFCRLVLKEFSGFH